MQSKSKASNKIITRSQTRQAQLVETHKTSNICVCPASGIMNADQKEEFKALLTDFLATLKGDLEKEAHKTSTFLDSLQNKIDRKATTNGLQPEPFDGNPMADASVWLENFRRIAKLNNWSDELQLNAFPLYLQGIANAWFLALPATVSGDLNELFTAFQERFASGPQDWILSQQLSARKHVPNEPIDDYITDITRLCKRLKLSDAETVRYFIEGLHGDLQAYVSLGRPKTFQEAESLARMKDIVNRRQGIIDTQSVLTKMQTMFTKFMEQPSSDSKVIAAAAPAPNTSDVDKKLEELSNQLKQIQKQQEWYQQQMQSGYAVAAYDQPMWTSRPFQSRNWQGQQINQIDQLQRRVTRLGNELRRYQNPRYSANRSYDRSCRGWNDDYNDEDSSPPYHNQRLMLAIEGPSNSNQGNA